MLPYERIGDEIERKEHWEGFWKVLAEMEGLVHLRVDIRVDLIFCKDWDEDTDLTLLEPIRAVTGPKQFQIALPFRSQHGNAWDTLLCKVQWESAWPNYFDEFTNR